MEYIVLNRTAPISKIKVEYLCLYCGTKLKNPIDEAGTKDKCPECGGEFEVPGKEDLEKLNTRDLEENMKTASVDLLKAKEKSKSKVAADHLSTLFKNRKRANARWTDRVNHWLAKTVAELNGLLFILICLAGTFAGGLQLFQIKWTEYGDFFYRGFLCTVMILGSILVGISVCGFTALICSMHKNLDQLSKEI